MDFEAYAVRFRHAAEAQQREETYVDACLAYAGTLHGNGVPIIFDVEHLASLIGYDGIYILGAAYATDRFYRRFNIPKKAGGLRTIHEPLPSLKEVQRWLLDNLFSQVPVSPYAKGFVAERSIKDNARFHRKQPFVLSLDLKDFFPSIGRYRVFGLLRSLGYSRHIANVIARLCTRENVLPQGAPTSPAISNLVARDFDKRLSGYARKNKLRYTRYADDITFSGRLDAGSIVRFVRRVATEEGFTLNEAKTRMMQPHQQQEVTGVVVNSAMHAPRETIRKLRQEVHYIRRFGLAEHMSRQNTIRSNYLKHLMGIANFILFVDPKNSEVKQILGYLHTLAEFQPV